jgi:CAAX protease family protein
MKGGEGLLPSAPADRLGSAPAARRDIWLFLALLFALSCACYALVFLAPKAAQQWLFYYSGVFMWCPGLAALLVQLVLYRSLRGLGWGWGAGRYYVLAYLLPLAFCLPVYLLVWLLGLGDFNHEFVEASRSRVGLPPGLFANLGLILLALVAAPTNMMVTLGEELGWRGFLVPRLRAVTSFTGTSLLTGLIWSAWHYPVIVAVLPLHRPHLPLWYATACFTVSVVAISVVYTWLRLRSGSVWPAALLHATSNAFQGGFEALTKDTGMTSYLTFEYGVGFALVIPLIAFAFWRKRHDVEPASASA